MKYQKGFASVLLVLVVILAVVGGLFYYGVMNGNLLKTSDPNLDTTQKFDEQMNTDSISNTSDWKTYADSTNTFQLKYPSDWEFYNFDNIEVAFGPKELIDRNREQLNDVTIGALIGGKAWPISVEQLHQGIYYYNATEVPFSSSNEELIASQEIPFN